MFEALFEAIPDAVLVLDAEGTVVAANARVEGVFRTPRATILGQSVEALIPQRYRQRHVHHRGLYMEAPASRPMGAGYDLHGLRGDGTEFPADISLSPIEFEGATRVVCVVRDVTERRRMEQELREAHDDLDLRVRQRTAELAKVNEVLRTEIGNRQRAARRLKAQNALSRVVAEAANRPEAYRKALATLGEHLRWDLGELWLVDYVRQHISCVESWARPSVGSTPFAPGSPFLKGQGLPGRIWEQRTPLWVEDVLHDPTFGRTFLAEAAGLHSAIGFPITFQDEVLGVMLFFSGATRPPDRGLLDLCTAMGSQLGQFLQRKRAEEALQRAYEELKSTQDQVIQAERLRALGQMSSGIAHDINNSLSAIMLFAGIALRKPDLPADLVSCLENISKATADAAGTISRLREFYRPQDVGGLFEPVDVNDVVQDAVSLTRARWKDEPQSRGTHIEVVFDLAARRTVAGHGSELREVLMNLILNAADAMPEGGVLSLRTQDHDGGVRIEVSDTGSGMDEETRLRVFEPFFTTKGPQGTGLGMSVCWGVVQRHRGHIAVETAPGQGTTFSIVLPTGSLDSADVDTDGGPLPSLRILCVDDEPLLRQGLQALLTDMGHSVVVAAGGAEALERFQKDPFQVVITDLGMPEVSGHEVARRIKEMSPSTPVILLTGWGEWQDISSSPYVDRVERKPPTPQSLEKALRGVLPLVG